MRMTDLLFPETIVLGFSAEQALDVIDELSRRAALRARLDFLTVFEVVAEKYATKSFATIGSAAIFHATFRMLETEVGALARLAQPVRLGPPHWTEIDTAILVLCPETKELTHPAAVKAVTGILGSPLVCERLRAAKDVQSAFRALDIERSV